MTETLTISHIDHDLMQKLQELARQDHTSIEDVALRYLHKSVDVPGGVYSKPDKNDILEKLSGKWSENESKEFDENTSLLRRIDPEIWN